jgi:hypothetical protein
MYYAPNSFTNRAFSILSERCCLEHFTGTPHPGARYQRLLMANSEEMGIDLGAHGSFFATDRKLPQGPLCADCRLPRFGFQCLL